MVEREEVIATLKKCFDPEIPINIVDLGLIYKVDIEGEKINVKMTLTAPGCPASGYISQDVKKKLMGIPGVKNVDVEVVWDPPWSPAMMSETAKKQFGWGL